MEKYERNDELLGKGELVFGIFEHKNPKDNSMGSPAMSLHIGYDKELSESFIYGIGGSLVRDFLPLYGVDLEKFRSSINAAIDEEIKNPHINLGAHLFKESE